MNDNRRIIIKKDKKIFKNLYEKYYSQAVLFATSIVYDKEEAKDIVQEVFFYLWDNADNIRIKTSIKQYIFTAVKNKSLNLIRQYKIRDNNEDQIREAYFMAGEMYPETDHDKVVKLRLGINELPKQMKKVLQLKVYEGKTYNEIAEELGISINTVKTHLKRAFDILRKQLILILIFMKLYFLSNC